ncbi:MAG: hypothetical protein WA139_05770 [Candidatus Aenigmatarchaeota archaeon]
METILLVSFVIAGFSMIIASFSAFYIYKFIRSYRGKFQKPMEYLFFTIALFALLMIEFGFIIATTPEVSPLLSAALPLTAIIISALLLAMSKAVFSAENELMAESYRTKKDFLQKKSKLIEEKFMKRKISEDMFKQLLLDLEKEIIDTDAKILMLDDGKKKEEQDQ